MLGCGALEENPGIQMLYIIANQYELTEFLLESLTSDQKCRVLMHPRRIRGAIYSILKALDAWLPFSIPFFRSFPLDYLSRLAEVSSGDSILIFGIENIKDLRIIRKNVCAGRISVFTWNPVIDYQQSHWLREKHISQIKGLGFDVFTFDSGDASNYGLTLIPQVYRDVDGYCFDQATDFDIHFIGKDKRRYETLKDMARKWQALGLRLSLKMVCDKGLNYSDSSPVELLTESISYKENLLLINRSESLLELVQKNQSGVTIRCLEAIFFNKKLITNNINVKYLPYFSEDRFFVLGVDDPFRLPAFLSRPVSPLSSSQLAPHVFKNWIQRFD